jgi:hypothetical protein
VLTESKVTAPEERRPWIPGALFARLALFAGRMGRSLFRLVSAMVPFVVRQGLRDFFGGKLALASEVQNIA